MPRGLFKRAGGSPSAILSLSCQLPVGLRRSKWTLCWRCGTGHPWVPAAQRPSHSAVGEFPEPEDPRGEVTVGWGHPWGCREEAPGGVPGGRRSSGIRPRCRLSRYE
ncbi:hypothetical protein GRJ2_002669700 [Grus japonensis]|uniref:Uncharacterized protein n=1 Tax=Grus japonensis TaxID=30415 RepID=A0ABC9XXB8_GRUJA